jgi:hypothetical protein
LGRRFPLIDLKPAEPFVCKIYNDSDHDAGVSLSIDGVNLFAFGEEHAEYRKLGLFVVPRHSWAVVPGWFLGLDRSMEFRPAGPIDGPAANLDRSAWKFGAISARFHAAWLEGEPQPPIETLGAKSAGDLPTQVRVQNKYETARRHFGASVLASVTVLYAKPQSAAETLP